LKSEDSYVAFSRYAVITGGIVTGNIYRAARAALPHSLCTFKDYIYPAASGLVRFPFPA